MKLSLRRIREKKVIQGSHQINQRKSMGPSLKDFCADRPELYEALSLFVLLDPERQLELGSADSFYLKGQEAAERSDQTMTRVNYDIAARIEIYYGHESKVREYLNLADQASETEDIHGRRQKLLANLETVMKIATSFYKHRNPASSQTANDPHEIPAVISRQQNPL